MDRTATRRSLVGTEQLNAERARLVRLCYHFTGSLDAAEDLAQETLYEALRNAHKLRDPSGYAQWLSAIARNVCRRWNERRGRELARLLPPGRQGNASGDEDADDLDIADEDYDLDVELDRRELVTLLDRALALLPAESREVLVARYVDDSPYAEIARRLGLNGPTVRKRLERGRLRLRQMLSTTFIHEAVAHGLMADQLFDDWDETPIWCPFCGRRHLLGKRMPGGRVWLICQPCLIPVNLYATVGPYCHVRGYSASLLRSLVEHDRYFGGGAAGVTEHCCRCGRLLPYRPTTECWLGSVTHYLHAWCDSCRNGAGQFGVTWQLLSTPEGQRFRQEHPRLRFLPDQEVEASGVPALVVRAESMTSRARLEGVFVRDTFERIRVGRTTGPLS
jgi:RNA polymerase sigma factor (sigma-70 family)